MAAIQRARLISLKRGERVFGDKFGRGCISTDWVDVI
jgi:hypothetical protein